MCLGVWILQAKPVGRTSTDERRWPRDFGITPAGGLSRVFLEVGCAAPDLGEKLMRGICETAMLLALLGLNAQSAQAQAAAGSAVTSSNSSMAAQGAKVVNPPSLTVPNPSDQTSSPHLLARTGPPAEEVNRKDFEDNAGAGASRLLLRSEPSGAAVFVNNILVGRTPLLMVIAPGKYNIDMRGSRLASGHRTVGLMPKETQTVLIHLNQRYPASVLTR